MHFYAAVASYSLFAGSVLSVPKVAVCYTSLEKRRLGEKCTQHLNKEETCNFFLPLSSSLTDLYKCAMAASKTRQVFLTKLFTLLSNQRGECSLQNFEEEAYKVPF